MHASSRRAVASSLTFRLRLAKTINELDHSCREASERSWDDADRARARDIALTLAEAFRLEGLRDPALLARSLGCLLAVSKEQILPIEREFLVKMNEVLASLRGTAEEILTKRGF
jgi:hypothetical protein